ncbi:MAG: hypothetical protein IRY99_03240, partial [Isosphaeraceae bacterium]|nr:hypothetical protein [Isosphaeraceae bacterium]
PFASTAEDAGRTFAANTPRIPPRGTPVTLYVQPADAQPPAAKPAPRP